MGLLNWLQGRDRRRILDSSFPTGWEPLVGRSHDQCRRLAPAELGHLRELVQVFVAEKNWEGCGGLALNDEIRVTIAAKACLLILALPHDLYRQVTAILVYPSTVVTPEQELGAFEIAHEPMAGPESIVGQAHHRGPVILAWDAIQTSVRRPGDGHDVVVHEFAHKLDMLDGAADGVPPLEDHDAYVQWTAVMSREFERLQASTARGRKSFLDAYGAVDEAEFFAVATEHFFGQPVTMRARHPELYERLADFYRQSPAARIQRPESGDEVTG